MRILADECVRYRIISALRDSDHDVYSIAERNHQLPDEDVLRIALEENRILLTNDKDLASTASCHPDVAGVVLMRLDPLSIPARAVVVRDFFNSHTIEGESWVLRPSGAKRI